MVSCFFSEVEGGLVIMWQSPPIFHFTYWKAQTVQNPAAVLVIICSLVSTCNAT